MDSISINAKLLTYKMISTNLKKTFKERCNAIVELYYIPHKDRDKHVVECLLSLISDDKIDIKDRYRFFNNHFFNNTILDKCHIFYFNNFNHSRYPIDLKISSAKYLLSHSPKHEFNSTDVHRFLLNLSRTHGNESIKRECANIIHHYGLKDFQEEVEYNRYDQGRINPFDNGPTTIRVTTLREDAIPENRRRLLIQRRTVYEDAQNVHNSSINESVKESILNLYNFAVSHNEFFSDTKENHTKRVSIMNNISMRITSLTKSYDIIKRKKILGSFDRIMTDAAKFDIQKRVELTLFDVLLLVWHEIQISKDKEELERCLLEELYNMNGVCTTGHLSRIVNILSGFSENVSIRISYKDQIKNYIFNYYNNLLKKDEDSELIMDEIIEGESKYHLLKFIERNKPFDNMKKEFVESKLVDQEDFIKYYKESVDSYCG